ncbi:MAG: hypothetical protein HYW22_02900 [Candidatus Aenigmarchaeota archaeon]|nr:hypothetical protein [Candidatus Aenigmarchaeota archaeon]
MKYTMIAPIGGNIDALYWSIKEFPIDRLVAIATKDKLNQVEKIKKDFLKFRIDVDEVEIEGNLWEETFKTISNIASSKKENIIVNVAAADRNMMCAATSAAFVNGLKAIDVMDDKVMMFPILKFSYYKLLSDKKMSIIRSLSREIDCCSSLEELSKKVKMSLPLLVYHINGNMKSEGLKVMGLVETEEKRGRIKIRLTELGRLLEKGYVTSVADGK